MRQISPNPLQLFSRPLPQNRVLVRVFYHPQFQSSPFLFQLVHCSICYPTSIDSILDHLPCRTLSLVGDFGGKAGLQQILFCSVFFQQHACFYTGKVSLSSRPSRAANSWSLGGLGTCDPMTTIPAGVQTGFRTIFSRKMMVTRCISSGMCKCKIPLLFFSTLTLFWTTSHAARFLL